MRVVVGRAQHAINAAFKIIERSAGASAPPRASDPLEGLTVHPEWGTVTGQGGVLKRGCRTYTRGIEGSGVT